MPIKKYAAVYLHLLTYAGKQLTQYRLNTLLRFIYAPSYVLIQYLTLAVAYHNAPHLGGWNSQEATLLFLEFNVLYGALFFTILSGIRNFMWNGARTGELDFALTKPLDPQFFVTFGRPSVDALLLFLGSFSLFIYQLSLLSEKISLLAYAGFGIAVVLSYLIAYGMYATYATLSIHMARAGQTVEFLDKMSDMGVYPMAIFPPPVQFIAYTLIPVAFFAYLPCAMLLGKISWQYLWLMAGTSVVALIISRVSWQWGLRNYTSASS